MKSYEGKITPIYQLLNNQSYEGLCLWKKNLKNINNEIMEDILYMKSLIGRPDGLNRLFCKP